MKNILIVLFIFFLFQNCTIKPKGAFIAPSTNVFTDYSKSENWSALPTKSDMADKVPNKTFEDMQSSAKADVFFLHPTTYTGSEKGQDQWYAPLTHEATNEKTDDTTIKHQASIFNAAGKVYAPRYRQMHLNGFYTDDENEKKQAAKAYELAYQDLKAAFDYYLKHYNNGRPIILAAHSQGTGHGIRLVKEFFDGKPLQKQLVAAYLIGWPVERDAFEQIKVCQSETETGCFLSWRSFKKGHFPDKYDSANNIVVTNPLNWTDGEKYAPKEINEGSVLLKYEKIYPKIADAQVENGVLWVTKPKFPGSIFWRTKNYHVADLNLFWVNVRKNAVARVEAFTNYD